MPDLIVERIDRPSDEARALLAELDAELGANYTAEQRHALTIERVFAPHVAFFIVRLSGAAVGCGGVAFDDGFAELKRMYVRPALRGKGVVQVLIARLETEAAARGYARVTLETGDAQHAAIRAYERAGFARCAAFGAYAALPAHAIIRSVFMEKRLARGALITSR